MSRLFSLSRAAVLFLIISVPSGLALAQSGAQEYPGIAKAVNYYLDGGTNNDFETLKKAFHETATMRYIRNGEYRDVNAVEFFGSRMQPGPASTRVTRIVSIDVAGNAAVAKLELEYPDAVIFDYMQLLKFGDEWKIVGKIFSSQPKKNAE